MVQYNKKTGKVAGGTGFSHKDGESVFVDLHDNVHPIDDIVADDETVINHQVLDVTPDELEIIDEDEDVTHCLNCDTEYEVCPNCGRKRYCPDCDVCEHCNRSKEFDLVSDVVGKISRTQHRKCKECKTEMQECPECHKVKFCRGCGVCMACGHTL